VSITVKRTGSAEYGTHLKVLLGGEPGSGKSVFGSNFPKPIYAAAEPGLMSIYDRDIPFVDINESMDLQQLRMSLDQPPEVRAELLGCEVETLIVDTFDEIQRILIKERLASTRKEAMQLQDWGWMGEQMQSIVRGLRSLDMHVVFIVHLKDTQDAESGRVWQDPGLQGAIAKQIPAAVDLALVLRAATVTEIDEESNTTRKRSVRLLQTQPSAQYPWLKDRSGKLEPEFEVGMFDSFDLLYKPIFGGVDTSVKPEPPLKVVTAPVVEEVAEEGPEEAPETAPVVTEPEPEPVVEAAPKVVEAPSPQAEPRFICDECGDEVEEEWASLSRIKYRVTLCNKHYKARKKS
jgi:hypothetical protein